MASVIRESQEPWEFGTLYLEMGSRAFNEMAGENSNLRTLVITKRAYRAGHGPKRTPAPKAITPTSHNYTKTTVSGGSTITTGNRYASGDMLSVMVGHDVEIVQLVRYSKRGNLVCRVMDNGAMPTITVNRQDVLCSMEGTEWEGVTP